MKSIEVAVLNPEVIPSAEKMMVCAARLTQRGHKIKSLDDFMALYNKSYTEDTVTTMTKLPHPTIQKFGAINVVIVGASSSLPGADHAPPERSQVHVCLAAVQRLLGRCCLRDSL